MKVGWRMYPVNPSSGLSRGYLTMAFQLRQALKKVDGLKVEDGGVVYPPQPKVLLHVCPPHVYQPMRGKTNVLFTMWEGDVLPPWLVAQLRRADAHIVPSEYCRRIWEAHGFTAAVVPLGAHPAWMAVDPSRPIVASRDRRMRFLWIGSQAARKGWELLGPAFKAAFGGAGAPKASLRVKTIGSLGDRGVAEHFGGDLIIDKRDLEPADLLALYLDHDAFVFPSYGEGFGLPVLEAMASGCLAVSTDTGGLADFVSQATAVVIARSRAIKIEYGGDGSGACLFDARVPAAADVADAMRQVAEAWGSLPLEAVRRLGTLRARSFTWAASAEKRSAALGAAISRPDGVPGRRTGRSRATLEFCASGGPSRRSA